MYRTMEDFRRDWRYESDVTTRTIRALSDASLEQRVKADGRSLGFLAWHIVISLGMATEAGLPEYEAVGGDTSHPPSAAGIAGVYEKSASGLVAAVEHPWKDASLLEEVPMYGE